MPIDLVHNFNIPDLVTTVTCAHNPSSHDHKTAQTSLIAFKTHTGSWQHVGTILSQTTDLNCHFLSLQILETTIKKRWNTFAPEHKISLRDFIIQEILARSKKSRDVLLERLNICLVEILKREWPARYSSFVPDIVSVSQAQGMDVCANSLDVLRRLNDDMNTDEITTVRRRRLNSTLRNELCYVYGLIDSVLSAGKTMTLSDRLVNACLSALESYSVWMSVRLLVESRVFEYLNHFINSRYCLASIRVINKLVGTRNQIGKPVDDERTSTSRGFATPEDQQYLPQLDAKIAETHKSLISFLDLYFAKFKTTKIHRVYSNMDRAEKDFVSSVSGLLCTLYERIFNLEQSDSESVKKGIRYLVKMTRIDDDKIFREILDFMRSFTESLYREYTFTKGRYQKHTWSETGASRYKYITENTNQIPNNGIPENNTPSLDRINMYESSMKGLTESVITKMPRPEEVFITENEYGEIVKEKMTESDLIEHSRSIQATLFFLSVPYKSHVLMVISTKISELQDPSKWSNTSLNAASWSAGCLANALPEDEEVDFFVSILKDLLYMCESKTKKEDKAILASNIMFIVGQFNRFLLKNARFLKTVIRKLFEFMDEPLEGIRDMAVDTFLKICCSCGAVLVNMSEDRTNYLVYLISILPSQTVNLKHYQKRIVYEGICKMIICINGDRRNYVALLAGVFYNDVRRQGQIVSINDIVDENNTKQILGDGELFKSLCHFLRCFAILFSSVEGATILCISNVFESFFMLFESVRNNKERNASILRNEITRVFVGSLEGKVKNSQCIELGNTLISKIVSDFTQNNESTYLILASKIIAYSQLPDQNIPGSTEHSSINNKSVMERDHFIINSILAPALRLSFSSEICLSALTLTETFLQSPHIFMPMVLANHDIFNLIYNYLLNSIAREKEISYTSLSCISKIIGYTNENRLFFFYQAYGLITLENLVGVVLDRDLSYSLDMQCKVLGELVSGICDCVYLGSDKSVTSGNNRTLVSEYIVNLFVNGFPNISRASVDLFVYGLFELCREHEVLKRHVVDFRVRIYELYGDEEMEEEIALVREWKQEIDIKQGRK